MLDSIIKDIIAAKRFDEFHLSVHSISKFLFNRQLVRYEVIYYEFYLVLFFVPPDRPGMCKIVDCIFYV